MFTDENRKQLFTFLLLTLALSSIFYFLIIKSGHLAAGGGMYVLCLMWSPGTAAMLTCKIFRRDLGTLGWKWGANRYQVLSYCIPLLYAAVTYIIVWATRPISRGGLASEQCRHGRGSCFICCSRQPGA